MIGRHGACGRRTLLAGLSALAAQPRPAGAGGSKVCDRLCLAWAPTAGVSADQIQRQFDLFRGLGFGTLRAGVGRIGTDPDRSTPDRNARLGHLKQAARSGLRLKLQVGTWSGTPEDYERQHPDARIVNADGQSPPPGYISPWYPDLKALLMRETAAFFTVLERAGLLGAVAALIADLGPAGEPIYPAAWILKEGPPSQATFWFYDEHAQAAFGPDMRRRFADDLDAANARWKTRFANWQAVRIPAPNTHPGPMWEDVLIWYRDAKRAIIRHQVATCRARIALAYDGATAPQLILLVPGTHLAAGELQRAAASGDGSYPVKLMVDTDFIIDLAHENGTAVQHTATQDEREVRYIEDYIRAKGYKVPLWGENAMGRPAGDPAHLADVAVRCNLYGLDYVDAAAVLRPDGAAPNDVMPRLAAACQRLLALWPTREAG